MTDVKNDQTSEIKNLSDTASDFFYFVQSFGDFLKVKDSLNTWMVEDPIPMSEIVGCGIFQLYFYENLFKSMSFSKIQSHKK